MRQQIAYHSSGFILIDDEAKIRFHPKRSEFAEVALGSYVVDSYDENSITITHDDPTKSGTYDLGLGLTTTAEEIAAEIADLLPLSPTAGETFSRLVVDLIREMIEI